MKKYARRLLERGIPADRIRKYGFAFRGKEVPIGKTCRLSGKRPDGPGIGHRPDEFVGLVGREF